MEGITTRQAQCTTVEALLDQVAVEQELYYQRNEPMLDLPGWCVVCHKPTRWHRDPLCPRCARACGPRKGWPTWLRFLDLERMAYRNVERGHTQVAELLDDLVADLAGQVDL